MTTATESMTKVLTGNEAAAEACRMARVGMVDYFPIGPSDEVVETLVEMIKRGELNAEVVALQNERSAVSALNTCTQGGVRAVFSTNSEGLMYGYQTIFWASYARVPTLIFVAHRGPEPPTLITPDDHDTLVFRDSTWIQWHCESPQEIFDTTFLAYRVGEAHDVMLPNFVTYAGWEVSHQSFPVQIPPQDVIDEFLPPFTLPPGTDFLGTWDFSDYYSTRMSGREARFGYMELRYAAHHALNVLATRRINEGSREWARLTGRDWGGVAQAYRCEDADVVLLTMGNIAILARDVADEMREDGLKVGVFKVRTIRPWPHEEAVKALANTRVVMTLERNPLLVQYHELRSSLYNLPGRPITLGRVVGLGGRALTHGLIRDLAEEALHIADRGMRPEDIDATEYQSGVQWAFRVVKGR